MAQSKGTFISARGPFISPYGPFISSYGSFISSRGSFNGAGGSCISPYGSAFSTLLGELGTVRTVSLSQNLPRRGGRAGGAAHSLLQCRQLVGQRDLRLLVGVGRGVGHAARFWCPAACSGWRCTAGSSSRRSPATPGDVLRLAARSRVIISAIIRNS